MNELYYIVQNEFIKLISRKRLAALLLVVIAMSALQAYGGYGNAKEFSQNSQILAQKKIFDDQIFILEKQITPTNSPEQAKNIKAQIEVLSQLRNKVDIREGKSNEQIAKEEIFDYQEQLENLPPNQQTREGELKLTLRSAQYRLAHNLPPFHNASMWYWIMRFFEFGTQIIIPLLCVFLAADIISSEYARGTIKSLLTRAPSRGKILFGKYLTSIIANLFIVAMLFLSMALFLYIPFGSGRGDDPQFVNVHYKEVKDFTNGHFISTMAPDGDSGEIISIKEYITGSVLLILIASLVMTTIGFACSVFIRSAAVSTGVAMALIIAGVLAAHAAVQSSMLKFLPMSHFYLPAIWAGDIATFYGYSISLTFSFWILALWLVVLYLTAHLVFTRRDVLN